MTIPLVLLHIAKLTLSFSSDCSNWPLLPEITKLTLFFSSDLSNWALLPLISRSSSSAVSPWLDNPPLSVDTPSAVGSAWLLGRCYGHCSGPHSGNTWWWGYFSTFQWALHISTIALLVSHHLGSYDLHRTYNGLVVDCTVSQVEVVFNCQLLIIQSKFCWG